MIERIINQIWRVLYRIPPQTYGLLIMGLALWLIATSARDLVSILPEVLSSEEVHSFW